MKHQLSGSWALRLLGLLDGLEAFHESGFLHLDIAPDNILLAGQGDKERVMLIDYNSVYEQDTLQDGPVYYSTKAGYSVPEIHMGRRPTPAADLYSATAVFYRCLTGINVWQSSGNKQICHIGKIFWVIYMGCERRHYQNFRRPML